MAAVQGGTFGRILALAWLAFTNGQAQAQTPYIVKDLNTSTALATVEQSGPWRSFFSLGQLAWMQGFEPSSGGELWSTDGSVLGTALLADLCPGACSADPTILGAVHGVALGFTDPQQDPLHPAFLPPSQLWRSDGTPQGTYLLPGVAPGRDSVVAGGYLYYGLDDTGVWRTDGTNAGTQHLDALAPFISFGAGELTALGGRIVFVDSGVYGAHGAVVSSDGTAAGTTILHDFGRSAPYGLTAAGNRLFFLVAPPPPTPTVELWVSDGTAAGTLPVQSFAAVGNFEDPDEETVARFKTAGNHVYFLGDDGQHGRQIWISDGTAKGTLRLSSFPQDAFVSLTNTIGPSQIDEAAGHVVFVANAVTSAGGFTAGWQVWSSPTSPGPGGPSQVALCGQDCISETNLLVRIGGHVLFSAGTQLLSTDGTPAGTVELRCGKPCGGASVVPLLGAGYFAVSASRFEIWRTDGTAAGTRRFAAISGARYTGSSEVPFAIGSLGDHRILFTTDTPTGLWISDGTPTGTFQLAGAGELDASSAPGNFAVVGDRLLFTDHQLIPPYYDQDESQLWQTQGTPNSTSMLAGAGGLNVLAVAGDKAYLAFPESLDLWTWDPTQPAPTKVATLPADDSFTQLTSPAAYLGQLYFALGKGFNPAKADQYVWKSDGTAAGTGQAFALPAGYIFPANLAPLGRDLYFTSRGPLFGEEVLRSDGTTPGTTPLTQFGNAASQCPPQFTRVGSTVFFVGWDAASGLQPWKTDGTAAGTSLVADLPPGGSGAGPAELIEYQGALYFFAGSRSSGDRQALWRSDGSAPGTLELADFAIHSAPGGDQCDADPHFLTSTGSTLFFAADDGVHGRELWRSDGTAAGTLMVKDIAPGPADSIPTGLVAAAGEVFFAADDGLHGIELWRSDGTEAGTRMVADLASGASSSNPGNLAVLGSRLLFTADDGVTGGELWALPLAGAGCEASPAVLCVQGNRFAVSVEWEDSAGNAGMGQAVTLTGDTGYFWFFDPANVEVIVKVLDGRPLDGDFWVFYGALSDVRYALTVTDTVTGLSRRYENYAGVLASVADTHAFGPTGAAAERSPAGARPAATARARPAATARGRAAAAGSCGADALHLCLDAGRFAVEASWTDFSGHSGKGQAVTLTGDTGYFWFFDSANVEVVLKVLDGRAVNGKFWVFYGALSNVGYTLKVTDTTTGAVKVYTNPSGTLASVADTAAF
jgi:ELWxxDGT repeat protein